MRKQLGFTAIELITAIIVLLAAGTIFWIQKNEVTVANRDTLRKTSINAIYYNLEELVYPQLKGYPVKLNTDMLKAMDAALLKDPNGVEINQAGSNYRYEPSSCDGDVCQHYVLRASQFAFVDRLHTKIGK